MIYSSSRQDSLQAAIDQSAKAGLQVVEHNIVPMILDLPTAEQQHCREQLWRDVIWSWHFSEAGNMG